MRTLAQLGQQPQTGDTAADDGNIDLDDIADWFHEWFKIRERVLVVEQPSM